MEPSRGSGPAPGGTLPWFVRGDLDGFFGLAVDNLIQFLLILDLCVTMCGLDRAFVVSRILPGAAISLIAGNLFYAWQARQLARREGRLDVTALPFGINTVSLFAYVLFIMAPTFNDWAGRPGVTKEQAAMVAWQVGLVACLMSGVIETGGGLVAGWIRRTTPRAALLATLAGIAIGFISMEFVLKTFEHPLIAFVPLGILLARYLGRIRLPGGVPGGLLAILSGTAIAWLLHLTGGPGAVPLGGDLLGTIGLHPPLPSLGPLFAALGSADVWGRISIIVPMGLINVLGSIQSIESAAAEGDSFSGGPSLVVNGLTSMLASCFGSCFPTTIYIGHPGWKRMGARWGYSVLNGVFFTVIALTGLTGSIARIVPIEAGMAILIWIAMIIASQAFTATPKAHAPAVVLGLLPGIAAWGWLLVEMTQLGLKVSGKLPWSAALPELVDGLGGTLDAVRPRAARPEGGVPLLLDVPRGDRGLPRRAAVRQGGALEPRGVGVRLRRPDALLLAHGDRRARGDPPRLRLAGVRGVPRPRRDLRACSRFARGRTGGRGTRRRRGEAEPG